MTKTKNKLPLLWAVFAAYSVLTLLGALNHEVWLDEAQAWVILRDAPLSELPYILKVEGHPPLWYLILYPFVKLGFPADYVSLISWFFMTAGALVLLFKVELPLPLKAVILASSGFLFFNSVMLRVYCLIPLLLFLILWVYPKRREHAVIYGLLIALLANTHVFISGIVGMLGIFMLYELFSEWKSSSKKENIKKLFGLAAAGIGVLILVVPLIGSIGANGATAHISSNIGISTVFSKIHQTLEEIILGIILPSDCDSIWCLVLVILFKTGLAAMLILLWHWRKAFAVELGFLGTYYITCGLMWTTLPNRAVFLPLSLAFVFCLTQYEKPVIKNREIIEKITGNIRKLVRFLVKPDENAKKVLVGIVISFFAASVPSGFVLWFKDIGGNFSGAKDMAKYISENFDKDAVFVQLGAGMPEITFYDPDIGIFAAAAGDIETYSRWEYMYRPRLTSNAVLEKLSEYDDLYIIYYCVPNKPEPGKPLYTSVGMQEYSEKNTIAVCEYDSKEVEYYIEALIETDT